MLINFFNVSQQVIILFLLISLGAICTKLKILTDAAVKSLTTLVLYVVTICVIIISFDRPFDKTLISTMGITLASAFFAHFLGIIIIHFFLKDKNISRNAVLKYGVVFSNSGFMAFPLEYALLGKIGVLYGAIFVAVFNIMCWTYGIYIMNSSSQKRSIKKAILNPGTIGTIIGAILFFTPLSLPKILSESMTHIAMMNTPLPMILIGYFLATTKNFSILSDKNLIWALILRLIIIPSILLTTLYFIGVRGIVLSVIMIAASTPAAANTVMFAEIFGRDVELAAKFVSISTILSIITMPPIISLAMHLA